MNDGRCLRWAQGAGVNEGAVSSTIVGPEAEIGKSDGVYFDPSANGADENAQLDLSKLPQALALYQFASGEHWISKYIFCCIASGAKISFASVDYAWLLWYFFEDSYNDPR